MTYNADWHREHRSSPEWRARKSAYDRERRIRVRQARMAYDREWYARNRDRADARKAAWSARFPERLRMQRQVMNANAAAKRAGALGRISTRDLLQLPDACVYCGSRDKLTIDHKTPLSRGGANERANLTTACLSCNDRKGTRTDIEFLAEVAA